MDRKEIEKDNLVKFIDRVVSQSLNLFEEMVEELKDQVVHQVVTEKVIDVIWNLKQKISILVVYLQTFHSSDEEYKGPIVSRFRKEFGFTAEDCERGINYHTTEYMFILINKRLIEPAIHSWRTLLPNKEMLTKAMMTFWKRAITIINDLALSMKSDPNVVTNTSRDSEEWTELKKITTVYTQGSKIILEKIHDSIIHIERIGQIAHAKANNCFLELSQISAKDLRRIMETSDQEYDDIMEEIIPGRFKIDWTQKHTPKVTSSSISQLFYHYYRTQIRDAYVDIDFYGCFGCSDGLKDYWSVPEATTVKLARNFSMKKVALTKKLFFPVNILHGRLEQQTQGEVNSRVKKLSNPYQPVIFEDSDIIPPDILFKNSDGTKIDVRIICTRKIYLRQKLIDFSEEKEIPLYLKKSKIPKEQQQDQEVDTPLDKHSSPESSRKSEKQEKVKTGFFSRWFSSSSGSAKNKNRKLSTSSQNLPSSSGDEKSSFISVTPAPADDDSTLDATLNFNSQAGGFLNENYFDDTVNDSRSKSMNSTDSDDGNQRNAAKRSSIEKPATQKKVDCQSEK